MNLNHKVIGCIGLGNMGSAICMGLARIVKPQNIIGFDIDIPKAADFAAQAKITLSPSIEELSHKCDVIILAVKPAIIEQTAKQIKHKTKSKLIVSVAAGITIENLAGWLGDGFRIIRCMPNTPALIGEGMSVLSAISADEDDIICAKEIFSALGTVIVLPEHLMDAVTAVSGSGPAYVFTFIQSMADGAVKLGLSRNDALLLASQTVLGSAKMVLQGNEPIVLRGKVTSPGGTTIEAVHVLEKNGFSGIVMDAIEAAYCKAKNIKGK